MASCTWPRSAPEVHLAGSDGQPADPPPVTGHIGATSAPSVRDNRGHEWSADASPTNWFRGDHIRLKLRARDVRDLDMWAAKRNGDLFELEFGRRIEPVAIEVA
jgi:hypothetical protein